MIFYLIENILNILYSINADPATQRVKFHAIPISTVTKSETVVDLVYKSISMVIIVANIHGNEWQKNRKP